MNLNEFINCLNPHQIHHLQFATSNMPSRHTICIFPSANTAQTAQPIKDGQNVRNKQSPKALGDFQQVSGLPIQLCFRAIKNGFIVLCGMTTKHQRRDLPRECAHKTSLRSALNIQILNFKKFKKIIKLYKF